MKMNTNAADNISVAKKLFHSATIGEWSKVVEIYQQDSAAHKAKITWSGDTALHIAVSDIQEDIVEELVSIVKNNNSKEALEVRNKRGDTALHIAASLGSVRICSCIAEVDHSLIGTRNHDNETPLFVAALHGKRDAFLCLNSYLKNNRERGYSYSRRKDGQTILHCAIFSDFFDLAFQIIHLYEGLVNSVDEHGISPLHILASKPTAFLSGSQLGLLNGIIYKGIFVDDRMIDLSFHQPANISKEIQSMNYPDNYATCIHFLMLLTKLVQPSLKDAENPEATNHKPQGSSRLKKEAENRQAGKGHQLLPPNYHTCFDFVKLVSKAMLIVLGLGSPRIKRLEEKKKKHKWSVQIMNELLHRASLYEYEDNGSSPPPPSDYYERKPYVVFSGGDVTFATEAFHENDHPQQPMWSPDNDKNQEQNVMQISESTLEWNGAKKKMKKETPILIAAKYGITEMVEKILEVNPVAIHDLNSEKKNLVQLAVESRQPDVYLLLLTRQGIKDTMFRAVDEKGNNVIHLAAMLRDGSHLMPGYALQMQLEITWFEFVKNSMPHHFLVQYNEQGKTPRDVFTETHQGLVEKSGKWLTNTSESCSVVAALIATVAFATTATVPGGIKEGSGKPNLESHPAFNVYAISSLIALCSSVIAVVVFQAIRTSRYLVRDFEKDLPRKLFFGLTSMFVSIASILVAFCAGHFFVFRDKLKYAALPVYVVTCVLVTLFAVVQFPLYFDLALVSFKRIPQRS